MSDWEKLKEGINKGFYLRNLYELAELCRKIGPKTKIPLVLFTFRGIFLGLSSKWEGNPLEVEEEKEVRLALINPMLEIITLMEGIEQPGEIFVKLNELVIRYDQCFSKSKNQQ